MVKLFYTTYISVDLAHQVIFHAKVGKGGVNWLFRYKIAIFFTMPMENFRTVPGKQASE